MTVVDTEKISYATTIRRIREAQGGFITKTDLPIIVQQNRLAPILVRCGGGRFTCPAQDVEHFLEIVQKSGIEYVRDVALVAGWGY